MAQPVSLEDQQPQPVSPSACQTHREKHSNFGDMIRDFTIGFADGLTVPFALTAGLSSLGSAKLVIVSGLAELFSGATSMGLGAYLAAATERDHYLSEERRERAEVASMPNAEKEEIREILAKYGVSRTASSAVVEDLVLNEDFWVQVCFMPSKDKADSAVHDGLRT